MAEQAITQQDDDPVVLSRSGRVAVLTLNRPHKMNAWTPAMEQRYLQFLQAIDDDPGVRAVVVTGAGRAYCVGADVGALEDMGSAGQNTDAGAGQALPMMATVALRKPVIAAINGSCAGVGLVQSLGCDLRFAAPGVKFTTSYARRGLGAEEGTSWMLPRLIGHANALDVLLSGRVFLSEEAHQLGLVNRIVPATELLDAAIDYARDLADNCSPASMAAIKRQVWGHVLDELRAAVAQDWSMTSQQLKTADFREGVASFLERRPASFGDLPAR